MTAVDSQASPKRRRNAAIFVVAGATVVALIAAYAYRNRGGPVLFGVYLGVGIAVSVAFSLTWLKPVTDLVVAVRPLGLPLVLVLAAGTIDSPLPLQLVAGAAALLIAWNLLVKPELPEAERVLGELLRRLKAWRGRPWQVGVVAAIVVADVAIAWLAREAGSSALDERGGFASMWFAGALVLLLAAMVLRILGYATSRLRALVSLLALVAGYRIAVEIGVAPGYRLVHAHAEWLSVGLLVGLAAGGVILAGVWDLFTARPAAGRLRRQARAAMSEEVVSPARTALFRSLGLASCVLAALALFVAMVLSANPGGASGTLSSRLNAGRPGRADVVPAAMTDPALARVYAPVLLFSRRERWAPEPVAGFLNDAKVTDWNRRPVHARVAGLTDCPGIVLAPCYQLTIRCPDGQDACADGHQQPAGKQVRNGTVYVRVVHRDAPPDDGSPNPFEPFGPWANQTTILLQYWLFYRYDDWVSPVVAGQLQQHHEADWEAVTIGLSDQGPLFAALSEHCGGQWFAWGDMEATGRPRVRPLVAVADGSHANYRYPNPAQAPDWTGCANLPARTTTLLSYASNIRDRTGADWSWQASHRPLVDGRTFPMSFVGLWAPYSRTELVTLYRREKLGRDALGPATPSLQALWRQPMRTIFYSRTWHPGTAAG